MALHGMRKAQHPCIPLLNSALAMMEQLGTIWRVGAPAGGCSRLTRAPVPIPTLPILNLGGPPAMPPQVFVVELARKPLFPGIYTPVMVSGSEALIREITEARKQGWVCPPCTRLHVLWGR